MSLLPVRFSLTVLSFLYLGVFLFNFLNFWWSTGFGFSNVSTNNKEMIFIFFFFLFSHLFFGKLISHRCKDTFYISVWFVWTTKFVWLLEDRINYEQTYGTNVVKLIVRKASRGCLRTNLLLCMVVDFSIAIKICKSDCIIYMYIIDLVDDQFVPQIITRIQENSMWR